jgi:hypothetical protein
VGHETKRARISIDSRGCAFYVRLMCAKQSLKQPVGRRAFGFRVCEIQMPKSPTPENTIRTGYHNWRSTPRGVGRSPVRNDAGRNALSGVKVSSPVNQPVPGWPSKYEAAKATPLTLVRGTLGVQVHGMYRRLVQELGRSPASRTRNRIETQGQGVNTKSKATPAGEVRWSRSSETRSVRKHTTKEMG